MNEQQRLLAAIWQSPSVEHCFDERGIAIYRRNLLANARRALAVSFPTIFELLSEDDGTELVNDFLRYSPPNQGDWSVWGNDFPHFIADHQLSESFVYLADCAALDWLVHKALHGKDDTLVQKSLNLLGEQDPARLRLVMNSNVAFITSPFPIADIYVAHHAENERERATALKSAKRSLSHSLRERAVLVYRPEYQPQVTILNESQELFINALLANESLEIALESVSQFCDFSFEQWLINAIENNLIVGVEQI